MKKKSKKSIEAEKPVEAAAILESYPTFVYFGYAIIPVGGDKVIVTHRWPHKDAGTKWYYVKKSGILYKKGDKV
jgi:hypothetical protein